MWMQEKHVFSFCAMVLVMFSGEMAMSAPPPKAWVNNEHATLRLLPKVAYMAERLNNKGERYGLKICPSKPQFDELEKRHTDFIKQMDGWGANYVSKDLISGHLAKVRIECF